MNLKSDSLLKTRAKRSSSETLFKRSAPDTDRNGVWINGAKIFPELISDLLTDGHMVKFRAPGESMYPTIRNGDVITVTPLGASSVTNSDIILYQHGSGVTAHRAMRIIKRSEENSRSAPKGPQDRSFNPQSLALSPSPIYSRLTEPLLKRSTLKAKRSASFTQIPKTAIIVNSTPITRFDCDVG